MKALIIARLKESIDVKKKMLEDEILQTTIFDVAKAIIEAFKNDKKVLLCGNGGSAADAQHIAAELSGRFYKDRNPLFAEALHVNTSYLTAVANDYSYDEVYSRLVKAKGSKKGDRSIIHLWQGSKKGDRSIIHLWQDMGLTCLPGSREKVLLSVAFV